MNISIEKYPYNKDCVLAITIDDLHPEGVKNIEGLDFGFDFSAPFWRRIEDLSREVPEACVTLFSVGSWVDRNDFPGGIFWPFRKIYRKRRAYAKGTFDISQDKFTDWVNNVNKYAERGRVEIALHGLEHHAYDKNVPQSQEFAGIDETQTREKIIEMKSIFQRSGLRHRLGFRAPGWGINPYLHSVFAEQGFLYTANNSDFSSPIDQNLSKGAGLMGQYLFTENRLADGMYNFTANCYPFQVKRAVEIAKKNGIIVVHAHICQTTFGLHFVDKKFVQRIKTIFREIRFQTLSHVWFASLGQIAEFLHAKEKLTYDILSEEVVVFNNNSKFDLFGLTVKIDGKSHVIDKIPANGREFFTLKKKEAVEKVSLILTVYNGEKSLKRSLHSLLNQTYENLEVIVVNDGSTDNSKKILDDFLGHFPYSWFRVVDQENQGRSRARNAGFIASSGNIVAFCEDDALYDKRYVEEALLAFEKGGNMTTGVIGPHYVWNRNESVMTRVKDIERRRNFLQYRPQSCWFYKRDSFEQVGRFNESLEFGEDVEPAIKLSKKGYLFQYAEEARWLHLEPKTLIHCLKRKFKGGVGMALLKKNGLKKNLIPLAYQGVVLILLSIALLAMFLFPYLVLPVLFTGLLVVGTVRFPSIWKVWSHTDEPILFLIIGVYVEYVWWTATLSGYIYGKTLTQEEINKYLRGR